MLFIEIKMGKVNSSCSIGNIVREMIINCIFLFLNMLFMKEFVLVLHQILSVLMRLVYSFIMKAQKRNSHSHKTSPIPFLVPDISIMFKPVTNF